VEILVGGEALAKESGAAHHAVRVRHEAAVGFVAENRLANAEHDERVKTTADGSQDQRGHNRTAKMREQVFHGIK